MKEIAGKIMVIVLILGTACMVQFVRAGELLINEIFPNPVGTDDNLEWIEIINTTNGWFDAKNWQIQTSSGTDDAFVTTVVISDHVYLPPFGYLVVAEYLVNVSGIGATTVVYQPSSPGLDINMQNGDTHTEGVRLLRSDQAVSDTIIYASPNTNNIPGDAPDVAGDHPAEKPAEGESLARCPDGEDTNLCSVDFLRRTTSQITLGNENICIVPSPTRTPTASPTSQYSFTPTVTPTHAATLLPGQVLINEIVYDGVGADTAYANEWIELYNTTDTALSLNGCRIQTAGTTFVNSYIIGNFSITAHGYFLLYESDVTPPTGCAPDCIQVSFNPDLPNGGSVADGVRLVDSLGAVCDTVIYAGNNTHNLPDDSGSAAVSIAPAATDGAALARCPNGVDTNLSGVDFTVRPISLETMNQPNACATFTPSPTRTITPTPTGSPSSPTATATPNCSGARPCDQESLDNNGVEAWYYPQQPDYWHLNGSSITATQEHVIVHGGSTSCKLTWTAIATQGITQTIGIAPSAFYDFSVWVFDNTNAGKARIWVQWLDSSGNVINSIYSGYSTDFAHWQKLDTGLLLSPPTAACASFQVRFYDEPGWVDSATIYLDDASALRPCNVVPATSPWSIMVAVMILGVFLATARRKL